MNDVDTAAARRLLSCAAWCWTSGMTAQRTRPDGAVRSVAFLLEDLQFSRHFVAVVSDVDDDGIFGDWRVVTGWDPDEVCADGAVWLPNVSDPPTLGCLCRSSRTAQCSGLPSRHGPDS